MENSKKEITAEELKELIQSQEGEFIIHLELGKAEAADEDK